MSTDARMKRSVRDGLQILWAYIRPEVIISQGKSWEDSFFWEGVEAHCRDSRTPHIALPAASKDLMWMAYLDSAALQCKSFPSIPGLVSAQY